MRVLLPLVWLALVAGAAADREAQLARAMALFEAGRTAEAARLLRPLGYEGSAVAETALGLIAAETSPSVAAAHYYRAAERGYAPAQLLLAQAMAAGAGTPARPAEALRWALVAETHGSAAVRSKARAFTARLMRGMDPAAVARARDRAAAWRPWDAMPG